MESTSSNPLLAMLGKCATIEGERVPVWTQLPSWSSSTGVHREMDDAERAEVAPAVDPSGTGDDCCHFQSVQQTSTPAKRRRLTKKSTATSHKVQTGHETRNSSSRKDQRELYLKNKKAKTEHRDRLCYATSWDYYIEGNIISETSRRFISNLLAATAAVKNADSDDSSGDSDLEEWRRFDPRVGDMNLVRSTLHGIASRSQDEGVKAIGRHARTIRLGRAIWQSPPLPEEITSRIEETCFDDDSFPPAKEIQKALAAAKKRKRSKTGTFRRQDQAAGI